MMEVHSCICLSGLGIEELVHQLLIGLELKGLCCVVHLQTAYS